MKAWPFVVANLITGAVAVSIVALMRPQPEAAGLDLSNLFVANAGDEPGEEEDDGPGIGFTANI